MTNVSRWPGKRWLLAHTLGIAFSLSHVMLDLWAGVVGPLSDSLRLTAPQVLLLVVGAGIYALWAYALVMSSLGSRGWLWATIGLAAVASLNGFSIVSCPPPCAFPVGDLSHIGSLGFCLWAMLESGLALRPRSSTAAMQDREYVSQRRVP